jgi:hypothetical protein
MNALFAPCYIAIIVIVGLELKQLNPWRRKP